MISLLIYLAQIIPSIKSLFEFFSILSGIVCVLLFSLRLIIAGSNEDPESHKKEDTLKILKRGFNKSFLAFLFILIIANLLPNATTMYLIASERYLGSTDLPAKAKMALESKLDEIVNGNKKN